MTSGGTCRRCNFYTADLALLDAMPALLRARAALPAAMGLLRHLTVGLGYLPSWASPRLRTVARRPGRSELLPGFEVGPEGPQPGRIPMLREVLRRMTRAAPYLDLLPISVMQFVSAGGKSYHFGGSFPHTPPDDGRPLGTDQVGRLKAWRRIHLVDGSVLPSIPASTFTLTVMANAHRIAEDSVVLRDG